MKTSTKILIILTILSFVPNIFLTKYLLQAIVPTGGGFVLNFTPLAWVSLAFQILANILFGILFFRFLKTQRLSNVIFFSLFPLTLTYGAFMVYVVAVKTMDGITAESVRATLNIATQENSYNNFLWAGLATIVYLFLVFLIVLFSCRPLSRVEKVAQTLGDGRMKVDDFKIGGGKQFKEIEYSLNKINYNYKEKENKLRQTNLGAQKLVPRQFFKFLGKENVARLEMGSQVRVEAVTMMCDLKSASNLSKNLSMEENFNYINSYLKVVSPLIGKYEGFVDKYMGDGILAVFSKPQNAIECGHMILKTIDSKNKEQNNLPNIDVRLAVNNGEVVFGIVGDIDRKTPTIVSEVMNVTTKMQEMNLVLGTKFIMSKSVLNELPQNFKLEYRYIGNVLVEGKTPVSMFESLLKYSKSRKDKLKKLKNKFEESVRAFNERNFEEAKLGFEYILKELPEDKPSYFYFNKCVENLKDNK